MLSGKETAKLAGDAHFCNRALRKWRQEDCCHSGTGGVRERREKVGEIAIIFFKSDILMQQRNLLHTIEIVVFIVI